jgi:hypothetical protein
MLNALISPPSLSRRRHPEPKAKDLRIPYGTAAEEDRRISLLRIADCSPETIDFVPRYTSVAERPRGPMRHLIWFLILPPGLAYCLWQAYSYKQWTTGVSSNVSFGLNGKHGYWILLAICYAASLGLAIALHKI